MRLGLLTICAANWMAQEGYQLVLSSLIFWLTALSMSSTNNSQGVTAKTTFGMSMI